MQKNNTNYHNNQKKDFSSKPTTQQNPNSDDLMYEIEILLEGMLYYAGVKREKLQKACDLFVENIDEILSNSDNEGVDEMIEVVDFLKNEHPDLFK